MEGSGSDFTAGAFIVDGGGDGCMEFDGRIFHDWFG
jgi:hypothetical protein